MPWLLKTARAFLLSITFPFPTMTTNPKAIEPFDSSKYDLELDLKHIKMLRSLSIYLQHNPISGCPLTTMELGKLYKFSSLLEEFHKRGFRKMSEIQDAIMSVRSIESSFSEE